MQPYCSPWQGSVGSVRRSLVKRCARGVVFGSVRRAAFGGRLGWLRRACGFVGFRVGFVVAGFSGGVGGCFLRRVQGVERVWACEVLNDYFM